VTAVITLFVVGIVLLAVEVLVPGAVLGVFGGIALLAGVITAFVQFDATGGMIASALALLLGGITLYFEFVILPKTRLARALSMTETVTGRSQPEIANPKDVVGLEAVAVTTLAPSGYVELTGRRYEASCQSGLVEVGARLRVVDVDNFRLIVTQIRNPS